MSKNENIKNGIFPLGELNVDYAKYFIGDSYLKILSADSKININVANVTFEPGCRNNWHSHTNKGFQILLVTGGEGWGKKHNF